MSIWDSGIGHSRTTMFGENAAPAIPRLILVMREARIADAMAGVNARNALGEIGKPAVNPLLEVLTTERGPGADQAILALGRIGPDAAPAVPRLREIYRQLHDVLLRRGSRDSAVLTAQIAGLRNTAYALGSIGPAAESALPDLLLGIDVGISDRHAMTDSTSCHRPHRRRAHGTRRTAGEEVRSPRYDCPARGGHRGREGWEVGGR